MDFDITTRKQTEAALRESEERFPSGTETFSDYGVLQDRELRYTWVYNRPFRARPVTCWKGFVRVLGPKEGGAIAEVRRRVLESRVGVRQEVQVTDAGRKHYFDTTIEPAFDSAGQ